MEKPTDTAIRPLHETELPAASALAGRVFAEFEAPEYSLWTLALISTNCCIETAFIQ